MSLYKLVQGDVICWYFFSSISFMVRDFYNTQISLTNAWIIFIDIVKQIFTILELFNSVAY